MSKSTKIIAGLGVAAALGVAALPVASYASTNYTGNVALSATIQGDISIKIDSDDMGSETAGTGDEVIFKDGESTNLSAGHFYKAGNTRIVIETNVPNTYTLQAKGGALTSNASTATIPVAGVVANSALADADNGAEYTTGASSMWGIKVSAADKGGSAISMTTNGSDASIFQGATKYMIGTTDTIVDFATVTGGKIKNTYTINYGLGLSADQPSGTYTGTANYTVTHVQGS